MKTWIMLGMNGEQSLALMMPETDVDFFNLGVRQGRRIEESLGLIHAASFLMAHGWHFDDACVTDYPDAYCLNTDFVGISVQINNYKNALSIASIAKKRGCLVILGGPHPANSAEQIIAQQPNVDIVVRGQGEAAMLKVIEGTITKGVIDETHIPFEKLPKRIRTGWLMNTAEFFDKKMGLIHLSEGCPQALCGKACVFCSIYHANKPSKRTVKQAVEEMTALKERGYGSLEITDDDFPNVGETYLRELLSEMDRAGLHFNIFVHTRVASALSGSRLQLLKDIGVKVLQTGFESGDVERKKAGADKSTLRQDDELLERCAKLGIKFQASFIFGMPGETYKSLGRTVERIKQLIGTDMLWALQIDPLIPLPGSKAHEMLCRLFPKFSERDHIDASELLEMWFSKFTHIKLEDAIKIRKMLLEKSGPQTGTAGMLLKL